MKKSISILLCMVLLFGIVSQAFANETLQPEEVSTQKAVKPIAYTHDFDGYSNVVGVLNSDGTKTAYLFASTEQVEQVDSVTGLVSTQEERLQRNDVAQSRGIYRPTIVEAPVYSKYENNNYGTEASMIIGTTTAYGVGRVYMKFDVSSLDSVGIAYTDILSACLYFTESTTIPNGTKSVIQAYLVSGEWEPSTVTWDNRPDYYGLEMMGCANVGYGKGAEPPLVNNELYITKAVMAWMQGLDNNGILLKEKDDEYDNRFFTSDWALANKRPYVTVTYSESSAYTVGQGIVNNASYFIVNKRTGKFLTAHNSATGTQITQQEFRDDCLSTQQWKFTQTSTTTNDYKITLGTTWRCLKNSAAASGSNVLLGTTAVTSAQTWKVFRNWNGTYHFQSKLSPYCSIKENNGFSYIIQSLYSCDFIHSDEWTLIPVTKGIASFFDFNILNGLDLMLNTTYGTSTMKEQSQRIAGFSSYEGLTNATASEGYSALVNSDLFYFSGHGLPGMLNFYNSSGISQGDIVVSDALVDDEDNDILLSENSLAQLQLAVLSSCETGKDSTSPSNTNMAGRLYQLGAHNVVSHFQSIESDFASAWDSTFMTGILLGRSLKSAKLRADNHLYDDFYMDLQGVNIYQPHGEVNERHDLGDESYVPGFSIDREKEKRYYSYQYFPQLTFSRSIQDDTEDVFSKYDEDNPIEQKFTLPKDAIGDLAPCHGNEFDVYMDEFGGIYWYYTNTNVLHMYEPYTEKLDLGDWIVDTDEALELAYEFLEETGYINDIDECLVKTSNQYSKNFTIEFYRTDTNRKYIFHMQSDGLVHITSFSAYVENYNTIHLGGDL